MLLFVILHVVQRQGCRFTIILYEKYLFKDFFFDSLRFSISLGHLTLNLTGSDPSAVQEQLSDQCFIIKIISDTYM